MRNGDYVGVFITLITYCDFLFLLIRRISLEDISLEVFYLVVVKMTMNHPY